MTKEIYLIRHGATEENLRGRFIGRTDSPLSAEGRRQAARLTPFVASFAEALCLCSPLQRARETAEIAWEGQDRTLDILADLREVDFGHWEGKTFAEIEAHDPQRVAKWCELSPDFTFPGGESLLRFERRIETLQEELYHLAAPQVLVFTHAGVIRWLLCLSLGLPFTAYLSFDVPPAAVIPLSLVNGRTRSARA